LFVALERSSLSKKVKKIKKKPKKFEKKVRKKIEKKSKKNRKNSRKVEEKQFEKIEISKIKKKLPASICLWTFVLQVYSPSFSFRTLFLWIFESFA